MINDTAVCVPVQVVDGDSLRCGSIRLRLLGIDAPEIHGCPHWRICAQGDGEASRRSLKAALRYGRVTYRVVGYDRYGRSLVLAWAGKINLACWQLQARQALYKPRWDTGGALAATCR